MRTQILCTIVLGALLSGCGPSESLKEEAYVAGLNSIWNKKCQGIVQPFMVPDRYDDSSRDGEVLRYYYVGIADASVSPDLCD